MRIRWLEDKETMTHFSYHANRLYKKMHLLSISGFLAMTLVISLGCGRARPDSDYSRVIIPAGKELPAEAKDTNFFFSYEFGGGITGSREQVLVITDNDKYPWHSIMGSGPGRRLPVYEEFYFVPDSVAKDMQSMLEKENMYALRSMLDDASTDGL